MQCSWVQTCHSSSWKPVRKSSGWLWFIEVSLQFLMPQQLPAASNVHQVECTSFVLRNQRRFDFTCDPVVLYIVYSSLLFIRIPLVSVTAIFRRSRWQCETKIRVEYEHPSFWSSQLRNDDVTGMLWGHLRSTVHPLKNSQQERVVRKNFSYINVTIIHLYEWICLFGVNFYPST